MVAVMAGRQDGRKRGAEGFRDIGQTAAPARPVRRAVCRCAGREGQARQTATSLLWEWRRVPAASGTHPLRRARATRNWSAPAASHSAMPSTRPPNIPSMRLSGHIRFEGTRWRLGGTDQADIGLADGGCDAGFVGPPRHGFVELAVAVRFAL